MEFRVLGPLEVVDAGRVVPIPAAKLRTLLATLLLRANQPTSLGQLADQLWADVSPDNPRRAIQTYVTRLRQLLGDDGTLIETLDGGYQIHVSPGQLDLARFEAKVAQALGTDDATEQASRLDEAVALWRGSPLGNVESEELHSRDVPRLAELYLQAQERRIDAHLRLGRPAELIADLRELTIAHPLREHLWAQLMQALWRAGRQAEALSAYETARRALDAELGIAPGDELRRMHAAVLAGETSTPRPTPAPVPRHLPPDVSGFTGRAEDLARLDALLAGDDALSVAVIAGTAGVGKTALATHWAHRIIDRFPDGQIYLNLRGYDLDRPVRAAQALASALRALGLPGAEIPLDLDALTGLYRSTIDGRRVLILLDNACHPDQVRPLLPGSSSSLVLVTSRDDLAGLIARDGAARVALTRLPEAEAVALLDGVLGPAGAADPVAVRELARMCAGLPLALRIAAERIADRPVRDMVAELRDGSRLDALTAGEDPYTAVRAVFSWSYRALAPAAARLFRLLGLVPASDWDCPAAAALADCPVPDARRLLGVLRAAHLIDPVGRDRFTMHDLLRAYAAEHVMIVESEAERREAGARLLDYYRHASTAAMDAAFPFGRQLRPHPRRHSGTPVPEFDRSEQAVAWLDALRPNLVATVGHAAEAGAPGVVLALSQSLERYLHVGGHLTESLAVHEAALAAATTLGDQDARATALVSLGTTYFMLSRLDEAIEHFGQALRIRRRTGDRSGVAAALNTLGCAYWQQGRYDDAFDRLRAALRACREVADRAAEAKVLGNLGIVYESWARYPDALEHHRQALAIRREIADRSAEANALLNLGSVLQRCGQLDEAHVLLCESLQIAREIGNRVREGEALDELGKVHLRWSDTDVAHEHHRRAIEIFREVGYRAREAEALSNLGQVYLRRGRHEDAIVHEQRALAIAREIGQRHVEVGALNGLGETSRATARPGESLEHHRAALRIARDLGEPYEQARALAGISAALGELGDCVSAAECWRDARALFAELGVPLLHPA
ncbi:MAG TPA: tetratricopeptide repeat protein [Jatrophihabitantaceae bacterium]|jgi:DNA-binding SARP family transcriptional activator/Tfp pilus assembly protein PilF